MLLLHLLIPLLPATLGLAIERNTELSSEERRELHAWLQNAQRGDKLRRDNSVYQVVEPHDATLAKRQGTGSCPNAQYRQKEILSTHEEWTEPQVMSGGCIDCFGNEAQCHITRTSGWSVSQTVSFGMDLGLAGDFADEISGNAGFNLGFSWTKGWNGDISGTCDTPAGKGDRISFRHKMGVAKVRSRLCRSSCINESCGDWEEAEAKYPLTDGNGLAIEPPVCTTVDTIEECLAGT